MPDDEILRRLLALDRERGDDGTRRCPAMGLPPPARPLVDRHDEIVALCRVYGVERLEVFGSAADGRFDPDRSDFDFIVRMAPRSQASLPRRHPGFIDALEALSGRHVHVPSDGPIDNRHLRQAVDASRRTRHDEPAVDASA